MKKKQLRIPNYLGLPEPLEGEPSDEKVIDDMRSILDSQMSATEKLKLINELTA